jgi:NAD(P)-dependent dehydrogenase (short-subunit alcohol dehydrogenase family)
MYRRVPDDARADAAAEAPSGQRRIVNVSSVASMLGIGSSIAYMARRAR